MATIKHVVVDDKGANVHDLEKDHLMSAWRQSPEQGAGVVLQIGAYRVVLDSNELRELTMLAVRPTSAEPPQSRVLGVYVFGTTPDEPSEG